MYGKRMHKRDVSQTCYADSRVEKFQGNIVRIYYISAYDPKGKVEFIVHITACCLCGKV